MHRSFFVFILLTALVISCKEEATLPKPKGVLRLEYPNPKVASYEDACPYTFEYNGLAQVKKDKGCNLTLEYPSMKGSIFLTYKPVEDNLKQLMIDADKLSYEHAAKADNIVPQVFENPEDKVYGVFFTVTGNAASQTQFYVTDSINHFVTGSAYFKVKPNYDSILPAAHYLQRDIRHIMETLRWNTPQ
ncbi:gliding motility lipoprotein GldD [Sediminicola luteus]|uniref:Gliding motility lipoprotein GldD n=1 Tax=Sediminicola luteus TaxID=319238 RepID=A0A2A4G4Z7_9FLAO|nr:gliding motility lipoprotein GldD [Sediminicola luteus]PCE62805.1 gliding motility lipoprotein GldD [Sediminicola luteus]